MRRREFITLVGGAPAAWPLKVAKSLGIGTGTVAHLKEASNESACGGAMNRGEPPKRLLLRD